MKVPRGTREPVAVGHDCARMYVVGPGACGGPWRDWVVGSSYASAEHLVITASPQPLTNDAKLVNGPAWHRGQRVEPVARVTIGGRRMRAVFVSPATNDGSAFANHVVLIWTVGRHTYGVGFHDVTSIRQTLARDEELAKSIELIRG